MTDKQSNKSRICVSLAEDSIAALEARLDAAAAEADLVELRFDALKIDFSKDETFTELRKFAEKACTGFPEKLIFTFRPRHAGGLQEFDFSQRLKFWTSVADFPIFAADIEEDIWDEVSRLFRRTIASYHDFAYSEKKLINIADCKPEPSKEVDSAFSETAESSEGNRQISNFSQSEGLVQTDSGRFSGKLSGHLSAHLIEIYDRLERLNPTFVKIAVSAKNAEDALPNFALLKYRPGSKSRFIPIAMGEAGKWTRILSAAQDVPIIFASQDELNKTATGQVSAGSLKHLFRVHEINLKTRIFGIIAADTSYSASPLIHNNAIAAAGLNACFVPFQTADISKFLTRFLPAMSKLFSFNFGGFAVTIPHKEAALSLADFTDRTARRIGAANTLLIDQDSGKIKAYNTDAAGFIRPIKKRISDLSSARAAVLGTGGAARAAIYALREEGAEVTLFGRNQAKAAELSKEFATSFVNCDVSSDRLDFRDFDIVVNATPIGSKNSKYSFNQHCHFRGVKIVYDLVYVPKLTAFLETGIRAGAEPIFGKEMLLEQAALQFEIWHGRSAPFEVMQAAIESL